VVKGKKRKGMNVPKSIVFQDKEGNTEGDEGHRRSARKDQSLFMSKRNMKRDENQCGETEGRNHPQKGGGGGSDVSNEKTSSRGRGNISSKVAAQTAKKRT